MHIQYILLRELTNEVANFEDMVGFVTGCGTNTEDVLGLLEEVLLPTSMRECPYLTMCLLSKCGLPV